MCSAAVLNTGEQCLIALYKYKIQGASVKVKKSAIWLPLNHTTPKVIGSAHL